MSVFLTALLQLERLFLPGLFALVVWAVWRTVFRQDLAVGLALYLGLVIIVDGFFNTGIFLPGLEKGSIRYSEICALFLLLNRLPTPPTHPPRRTVYLLVGLYFVLLFVSVLRSDPMLAGIFEFRRLIVPQIIALLVATRALYSPEQYRRFFLSLMALVILVGLFVFWDLFFDRWLLKSDTLSDSMYWNNRKHGRFGSFFLNPNYLGAFVVLVFPVTFVWAIKEQQPWTRLYAWIGLLALLFSLVETQSRGPLLAFGIALVLLVFGPAGEVSRKRRLGFLGIFVGAFAIFMPGFFEHAIERFDTLDQETTTEYGHSRRTAWFFSAAMIADHPLSGIGFGEQQYLKAMDTYVNAKEFGMKSLDNPHNSYLQAAVYAGIPALAAFLLANLALLRQAAGAAIRAGTNGRAHVVFGLAVGVVGFLMTIYTDMHLFTQTVAPVYWVFFGLLLALASEPPAEEAGGPLANTRPRARPKPETTRR